MGRIHRYRTALSRHHRSGGYGIHSPFAYAFVRNVLRERLPYYAYDELLRFRTVAAQQAEELIRHKGVITFKNAKMLFRISNYFQSRHILHVGVDYGVAVAATLMPDSLYTCTIYVRPSVSQSIAQQTLQPFESRTATFHRLDDALAHYTSVTGQLQQQVPFIVVDRIEGDDEYSTLNAFLSVMLQGESVVIIRNLASSRQMKKLWEHTKSQLQHGHTYTNEKLAVIVCRPGLPLQHFLLWF